MIACPDTALILISFIAILRRRDAKRMRAKCKLKEARSSFRCQHFRSAESLSFAHSLEVGDDRRRDATRYIGF